MAIGDISFYKYLEAAFRYRLFNPQGTRATLETRFNYLGYNLPFNRIFYYARRILPKFYTNAFPDTEEGNLQMARTVLEKLDKHQDLELSRYFVTAPEENVPVIAEAAKESAVQQAPSVTAPAARPLPGVAMRPPSVPRLPSVTQKASEPVASASQTPEVPQPTIGTARRFNLSGFRPPASLVNALKNFGSNLGVFFKKNIGNLFTASRIATLVSGGIGAIVGAGLTKGSLAGIVGGAGAGVVGSLAIKSGDATKFLSRIGNGAINVGVNISNQVSSGATRLSMSSGSKKLLWALLGAFILFFGISLFGGLTETTSPGKAGPLPPVGGGCPDTSGNRNPATCRYLNPSINLFDTNISQSAIDTYINKYSSIFINAGKGDLNEFKKRVDYIVSNAKAAGLNPAMFLGYWKTESMFSTMGDRDMGCQGSDFYNQVDCALGINAFTNPNTNPIANCAKSKDASSVACQALKSIRARSYDLTHPINYPIKTFDDFAEAYGPYDDLVGGQPTNCTHTYNELIDTAKELGVCQTAPAPGTDFASQLVDKIKNSEECRGYVIASTFNKCLPSINQPPLPDLTNKALTDSVFLLGNMGVLQCVGFVKAVATDLINQPGHAIAYSISGNVRGYEFIQRQTGDIKVGDLPVWNIGFFGHIASVVSVQNYGGFAVAEANLCLNCGKVDLRYDFTDNPAIVGWLRKR